MKKLLKWKVGEAPTGTYSSFSHRQWPSADDQNGNTAASLSCERSYTATLAKDSGEYDIIVHVADWTNDNNGRPNVNQGAFVWRKLTMTFKNVKDAKAAAERCLLAHPHFMRKAK